MTFSQQLKTLRTLRGLTQEELAAKTGIPNTMLSQMETGKVVPAGEWEIKIKTALDWPTDANAFAALLPQTEATA